jgi:hypothetical protein
MNNNRYWDEDEEFKVETIYQTREGRLKALNHIIRKYIEKTQGIKTNYKENVPMSMASIIEMIETDEEFRNFALLNYQVIIHSDNNDCERIHVRKITNEMAELIYENINNLDNQEFQDKLFSLEDHLYDNGREKDQQYRMERVKKDIIKYKEDDMLTSFRKIGDIVGTTENEQEQEQIRDATYSALREAEYYKFLKTILNKSYSLRLTSEWYIGVYYEILTEEIGLTEPFRPKNKNGIKLAKEMEKKFKELNKQLDDSNRIVFTIMKPITLDLYDNTTYYTIPETNGRFIEIADNKGYIDPDFSFEFPNYIANNRHFKNDISSIRRHDEAIEIFIKDSIRRSGFMYDTFENYIDMKLKFMELELDMMEEEDSKIREMIDN